MRTLEWAIEEIVGAHPNLYLQHCALMAVALMSRQSVSPCEFVVECEGFSPPALAGETRFTVRVSWSERSALKAQQIWQTEQPRPIMERAAVALAALLFAKLMPGEEMRVTRGGEHADYWLPHARCALEVSGTANPRALRQRHRKKTRQVLSNPLRWNGYVVICCFHPSHRVILWSYHKQEVKEDATS